MKKSIGKKKSYLEEYDDKITDILMCIFAQLYKCNIFLNHFFQAEQLRLKLERAALLVDCLSGEKIRWEQTVEILDEQYSKLPGDCLVATAFVSYLGPFVSQYRDLLLGQWIKEVKPAIKF